MWHLEKKTLTELTTYADKLIPLIAKRINEHRGKGNEQAWCDYLLPPLGNHSYDEKLIREILTAEPSRLFKLNSICLNEMLRRCQSGTPQAGMRDYYYSERQLRTYLKAKGKRNKGRREQVVVDKYMRLFVFLDKIFDYGFIKGELAYQVATMKRVNTCTYCNRLYTFTIGHDNEKGKKVSKVKPQFDHWYAHKQYPLLALSFYNLIPSCSVCNSSVKGSVHYSLKTHIHPYMTQSCEPSFKFLPALIYDSGRKSERWSVILKRDKNIRTDNTINALFLDRIYAEHGELEVKDIMDFAQKNNPTYLKALFSRVCEELEGNYTQVDVYRMMFGVEAETSKTLDRPFSKLKKDVLAGEGIKV